MVAPARLVPLIETLVVAAFAAGAATRISGAPEPEPPFAAGGVTTGGAAYVNCRLSGSAPATVTATGTTPTEAAGATNVSEVPVELMVAVTS